MTKADLIHTLSSVYKNTQGSLSKKVKAVCNSQNIEVIIDITMREQKEIKGYADKNEIYLRNLKEVRDAYVAFHEIAHVLFHLRVVHNKSAVEMEIEADNFAEKMFLAVFGKKYEWELVFLRRSEDYIKKYYA